MASPTGGVYWGWKAGKMLVVKSLRHRVSMDTALSDRVLPAVAALSYNTAYGFWKVQLITGEEINYTLNTPTASCSLISLVGHRCTTDLFHVMPSRPSLSRKHMTHDTAQKALLTDKQKWKQGSGLVDAMWPPWTMKSTRDKCYCQHHWCQPVVTISMNPRPFCNTIFTHP